MTATQPAPTHPEIGRPADAPTDFGYWEALHTPGVRRARRLCQRVLRFDPLPDEATVAALARDMRAGDPVAERFVDEVFFGPEGYAAGRRLLDRALAHGIDAIPDAPQAMRDLFAEFETVPDWVDPELVERGAAVWRRWGTDLFSVAGAGTLEMYTESAVALPLAFAGGYAGDKALNRFLETARFWIDVSTPGALLTPGSRGRATALRVRVMHVSVRRRVSDHPEWQPDRWGLPISQAYMLLTLMGGSVGPAIAMWPLGYLTSRRDIEALLHFQRYMGHLLGVRASTPYPAGIRAGIRFIAAPAIARTRTSGEHGAELIASFPRAFRAPDELRGRARLRAQYESALMNGFTAAFASPSLRREFDIPGLFPWVLVVAARIPGTFLREVYRHTGPAAAERVEARQVARREAWLRRHTGGRDAAFDASADLVR